MLDAIKALIQSRDICVLSTVSGGKPHCSLMSYMTDSTCRTFYMLTLAGTKKFRNLLKNRDVSILIDSREEDLDHRRQDVRALTVSGVFHHLDDPAEQKRFVQQLLEKHPHLKDFAESGEARVFAVRAKTFQLLEGLNQSYFEEVADEDTGEGQAS